MLVYITPLQGSHQCFAKGRNSQNGARLCYLANQQKKQFFSSGFASLGMRCCFSLCWGPRITSKWQKKKTTHKQAKWTKIIWYFWALQYIISFFFTSLSARTSDCVFVLLREVRCEFEHRSSPVLNNRRMTPLNTGWFGGFSVWLTCPYRNDGTLKKNPNNTYGVQVAPFLGVRGAFTQRFPGQWKQCLQLPPHQPSGDEICVERRWGHWANK